MKQNEKGILVKSSEKTRYFVGLSPLLVYVINGQWTLKKSSDIPLIVNQIKENNKITIPPYLQNNVKSFFLKGQCHEIYDPFFVKISTWALREVAKTVS